MRNMIIINTLVLVSLIPNNLFAQAEIDIESGLITSGYNDARIPGNNGTLFSFSEELKSDNEFYYRLRLNYRYGDKHTVSILIAPLTIHANGSFDNDVTFQDLTFPAHTSVDGIYIFNSYRLTYRNDFHQGERLEFGLGLTAKIRDAEIGLKNDYQESSKVNVGFVPIINFRLLYKMNEQLGLLLEGDALAAPQGRAEDVLAALTYRATDKATVKLGYRILEGGAGNDEVYTFSLIHYLAFAVSLEF